MSYCPGNHATGCVSSSFAITLKVVSSICEDMPLTYKLFKLFVTRIYFIISIISFNSQHQSKTYHRRISIKPLNTSILDLENLFFTGYGSKSLDSLWLNRCKSKQ